MTQKIVLNNWVYTRVLLTIFESDYMSSEYSVGFEVDSWFARSEPGKWCKDRCVKVETVTDDNFLTATIKIAVYGYMTESDRTFFLLKFGDTQNVRLPIR